MNSKLRVFGVFAVVGLLGAVGCSNKNALGRRAVAIVPDSVLNSQATAAFANEKKTKPLSKNVRWSQLTQQVADRLIVQAKKHYGQYCEGFQWEVQLFDAPDTVNAYCMPGGKIGFYSGILPVAETEAGIAVVMGHEIGHALLRHGNARATQQLGAQALTAMAAIAIQRKGDVEPTTQKALMTAVGMGAQYGVILPNSRVDENESDRIGLQLMAHAGYDPAEAARFWQRMSAKSGGKAPPEFMSTHPSGDRRVRRLTEFLVESGPYYQAAPVKYGLGEKL